MNKKEQEKIAGILGTQLIMGMEIDLNLSEKLIKGLCEDYKEERKGRQPSDCKENLA